MDSTSYSQMYKLVQKAKRYEKQGLHSKELEIYELIHEKYLPNSSNLYKRPAILYEKKGEYEKSLELCKKAVELIEADKISGTKKTFEKKIEILNRKLKKSPSKESTNNKSLPHLSIGLLIIFIMMGALFYYAFTKENTYENIQVDLSEMRTMNENSQDEENETPPDYPITATIIERSRGTINTDPQVIDSVVISDGASIGLGLLVEENTTYSESKKLASRYIKALGAAAASEYDLSAPILSNYGGIYDHYSVYVSVGTSNKKDDIILKAYMIKGANDLNFK